MLHTITGHTTSTDASTTTTIPPMDTTELPRPNSPIFSNRRKSPKALSWNSTTSSLSTGSTISLSSVSTPTTINTTSTIQLIMRRSPSRTLPLLMNDNDDDDDDDDDFDEHETDDEIFNTTLKETNQEMDDDERQQYLHQRHWYRRVTKSLTYAASHGDSFLVHQILTDERLRPFLNVNGSDDKQMGTTPLIYAACFGYITIVELLLDAGAAVDGQDKIGWSPLMWATANNHKVIVELLLSHGASWTNQTAKGRTFLDYADFNNEELVHCLTPPDLADDNNTDGKQHLFYDHLNLHKRRLRSGTTPKLDFDADTAFYYQPSPQQQLETKKPTTLMESILTEDDEEWDELVSCEASMNSLHHFVWNRCLPDQMFVFAEDDIPHILNVTISSLKLPMKTRQEIWVPSNVLFLCARFAYYYSGRDLLTGILDGAIKLVASVLHNNKGDIHTTAFWMANLSQLLYYLKKDTGLVVATAEQQLEVSELISETYALLITDSEKRIEKILDASMLDQDLIGADPVDFADDWQRFFRRRGSSRRPSSMASTATTGSNTTMENIVSMTSRVQEIYQDDPSTQQQQPQQQQQQYALDSGSNQQPISPSSPFMISSASCTTLSPHSITSLFSSILYVLQSYEVHPSIITQTMAQCFHFMSCEIFNRILANKKYVCRSKALQIRMNLSIIEDWVREQQPYLPSQLTSHFAPLIQLLQLLQCVSQLNQLTAFIAATTGFDLLNPLQIKRCVLNYRYEVDEPRLPDEVEKYTIQLARDAIKSDIQQHQKRWSVSNGGQSMELSGSKRNSIKSVSRNMSSSGQQQKASSSSIVSNASSHRQSQVSTRPTSVSSLGSLIMSRLTSSSAVSADDQQQPQQKQSRGIDETTQESRYRWDDEEDSDDDHDDHDDDDDADKIDQDDEATTTELQDQDLGDHEDGRVWMEEMRDSKYMLPFSLPTSTTMIHYATYQQQQLHSQLAVCHPGQQYGADDHNSNDFDDIDADDDDDVGDDIGDNTTATKRRRWRRQQEPSNNLRHLETSQSIYEQVRLKKGAAEREKKAKERMVIPTIPQEWMDRLDRHHEQQQQQQQKQGGADNSSIDDQGTENGSLLSSDGSRCDMDVC